VCFRLRPGKDPATDDVDPGRQFSSTDL